MRSRTCALAAGIALAVNGCATAPTVSRLYDGRAIEGRYVESDAYAALLRGAIAEATGDARGALASYDRAARSDPHSPELDARIGAVRCALDPHDARADEAIRDALRADASYAPAWEAEASCAAARGDRADAERAAHRAWEVRRARGDDGVRPALLSGAVARDPVAAAAVDLLLATARDPAAAVEAVAAWAREHDAVTLWASALRAQLAVAPSSRSAVAQQVDDLAGMGLASEARAVAAAVADVRDADEPLSCARCELARRLAVDEAIARDDAATARRRAVRMRLTLAELGARWLLAARPDRARAVARDVADADGTAVEPRLLLAAIDPSTGTGNGRALTATAPVSAATWFAWAAALTHGAPVDAVRATLLAVPREQAAPDDDVVLRREVDLAVRGVLPDNGLSPDAAVEVHAVRWATQTAGAIGLAPPQETDDLGAPLPDLRHELLRLAIARAASPRARDLAARLGRLSPRDRVVAAALGIESLRGAEAIDPSQPRQLLAIDPNDPLLAAVALRLAVKVGDADVVRQARAPLGSAPGRPTPTTE